MTTPPPQYPGGWDQPPAGTDWAPPSGYAGYPPPGYAPSGYPTAGYPQAGASPFGQKPGTNGFAIAALVLGIIGVSLISIVFGILALGQTRRTGQNGRGLAIAGLIISGAWIVLVAVLVVVGLTVVPQRGPTTGAG